MFEWDFFYILHNVILCEYSMEEYSDVMQGWSAYMVQP